MTLAITKRESDEVVLSGRNYGLRSLRGYSLVELLIVNALTLTLVTALFAATADLIATAAVSSAQSDQAMRGRQVVRFIEQALTTAQMPPEWLVDDAGTWSQAGWQTPSPICRPPDAISQSRRWGGVDVIEMTSLSCIAEGDARWGLYVEQITVCPDDCGAEAGYVISPMPCSGAAPGITGETQWQVLWQADMNRPTYCDIGWPWGRLQRLLLTDRSGGASIEGVPTLRFQSVSRGPTYAWQQAETLVAGIADWQPRMTVAAPFRKVSVGDKTATLQLLTVAMAVIPTADTHGLQDLRITRLLLPPDRGP